MFEAALAVDASSRREWIFTNAHSSVAEEVMSLLAADGAKSVPLDDPGTFLHLSMTDEPVGKGGRADVGERLGQFQIRSVLGSGRSGVVYRAWQEFPPREIALKVIRAAVWSRDASSRFATEVRALAKLSHPRIARVLESGTLPEPGGVRRPYLAMELVEGGRPIHHSVDGLDRMARLALIEDLCDAVAHAHQHGVLHRDLKPGNVLVGADGRLKVIDFGIARLEEDSDHATLTGQLLGTPAYMSPEQLRGGPTDTRTDVFAVGLIGREVMGPELNTGDIRIVLDKAAAADPTDRYQSAAELLQDLIRIREHRVILAKHASLPEIALKYAKRNRGFCLGIASVTLIALAAVISLGLFAGQTARANAEARDVASFMLDEMIDRLEDRIGSAAERRELATRLLVHVDRLALRSAEEPANVSRARLHRILGDEAQSAGDNTSALDHLGQAFTIRQRLAAARPDDRSRQAELSIAVVRVGDLLGCVGRPDQQRLHYERAMEIDRTLVAIDPADTHYASNLIYSLLRVADLAIKNDQPDLAMRLATEQLDIASAFLKRQPQDVTWLWEVVQAQSWLHDVVRSAGLQPRLVPSLNDRLDVARRLAGTDPESRRFAVRLTSVLLQLTSELAAVGRFSEAVAVAEEHVRNSQRLIDADPSDLTGIAWLARSMSSKAGVHAKMGDQLMVVACIDQAKDACEKFEQVRGLDWETTELWTDVLRREADSFTTLGMHDVANAANRAGASMLRNFRDQTAGTVQWREIALRIRCAVATITEPTQAERLEINAMTEVLGDQNQRPRQADLADQLCQAGRCAEALDLVHRIRELRGDPADPIGAQIDRIERTCRGLQQDEPSVR
jgi:tetratricopeptide (TPR) repeat protein